MNNMTIRYPTGNTQDGYYFYSLSTRLRLNRNRWTELPMPAEVIDRVHILACCSNAKNGLSFVDRNGINPHGIADDIDDKTYSPDDGADDHGKADDDALLDDNIARVNEQNEDEQNEDAKINEGANNEENVEDNGNIELDEEADHNNEQTIEADAVDKPINKQADTTRRPSLTKLWKINMARDLKDKICNPEGLAPTVTYMQHSKP
jgi:hypothetical protein